jgi:hypothetical protein
VDDGGCIEAGSNNAIARVNLPPHVEVVECSAANQAVERMIAQWNLSFSAGKKSECENESSAQCTVCLSSFELFFTGYHAFLGQSPWSGWLCFFSKRPNLNLTSSEPCFQVFCSRDCRARASWLVAHRINPIWHETLIHDQVGRNEHVAELLLLRLPKVLVSLILIYEQPKMISMKLANL